MPPTLRHRNATLFVDNSPLESGAVAEGYLTAEGTAAASTITVKNIIGFGINQVLLIEDLGTENAEIILTHASTVPSGTTVTLASNLVKTHPAGSKVRVLPFNQIELSRGTTTVAASGTVLTVTPSSTFNPASSLGSGLVAVDPTARIQTHWSDEHTSGYYFARYKNSITSDFSSYTDALPYGGWDKNTVGYVIWQALEELSLTISDKITRVGCYAWINDCLREIEGKITRWPEHYKFNYALTTLTAGDYDYTMPSDAYDTESNRSILAVRVGTGAALDYIDPMAFEEELDGVATTTAAEAGSVGETAIDLTNAADFADSDTITFFASGTEYSFTYTGKSGNTLTGVPSSGTGSITQAFSSGDTMYQGATFGKPTSFTVSNGALLFLPFPGEEEHGKNVAIDYALVATFVDSDGDTIDVQRYDMILPYLTWRMKMKARNNNNLDRNDGYYASYKERLNDAIRTSPTLGFRHTPRINRMRKR
jgi:hypothetical protein